MTVEIREVEANGLTFTCRTAGPDDGEPVLLLHGFPETSHMWVPLMTDLAAAGYRCVAPDQRGYSPGARPPDVADYHYEHLAADALAIAKAAGFDRFHLIGHDWGAAVGWAVLAVDPAPVASWTALSVAHYRAAAEAVWAEGEQADYRAILDLFLSDQAEAALGGNDMAGLRMAWSESSPAQHEAYAAVFGQPGALTAALNWYRASDAHRQALEPGGLEFGAVATPTLVLWGKNDPYVRAQSVHGAAKYMTGPYEVVELDAGHWLVQERPDEVRENVLKHLAAWKLT